MGRRQRARDRAQNRRKRAQESVAAFLKWKRSKKHRQPS